MGLIKEPSSRFVKLRCHKCKNEQIIFGKATSEVNCLICNQIIASPTGGKVRIKARILEILE
jgi:small subunit ribosomal protein S27e